MLPRGERRVTRPPIIVKGVPYDLGHLAPFVLQYPRPVSPPAVDEAPLRIEIAFSHHCYTVSTAEDPAAAETYHVTERGDVRLFNAARWKLSKAYLSGHDHGAPNRQGGAHAGDAKLPLCPQRAFV